MLQFVRECQPMNEAQVLKLLRETIKAHGSAATFALVHGIDSAIVSRVLRGKARPAKCVLNALGLEKVMRVSYRVENRIDAKDTES